MYTLPWILIAKPLAWLTSRCVATPSSVNYLIEKLDESDNSRITFPRAVKRTTATINQESLYGYVTTESSLPLGGPVPVSWGFLFAVLQVVICADELHLGWGCYFWLLPSAVLFCLSRHGVTATSAYFFILCLIILVKINGFSLAAYSHLGSFKTSYVCAESIAGARRPMHAG